ncbi:MAG: type II secretion system F family protein [Candidatus Aenigmatarchaeota archaeon]|nr:type II secretion system F family protein [Candidatus Aenigmarchaeota archaeon]
MVRFSFFIAGAVIVYAIFALFNYLYLSKIIGYAITMYLVGGIIVALPLIIIKFYENRRIKEMEKNFPVFLQDFVEAIRGGMTVPQAFKTISVNQYGALTPLVRKITAQLDWGIPVETVLLQFSKDTKSRMISRIVSTVMESHKFGGKLVETFEALSSTAIEVERLRAERRLFLNSQIITGYIIFFVFLAVIIGLEKYLVPSLGQVSAQSLTQVSTGGSAVSQTNLQREYSEIFRNLILLQALFAGLTVGKMSEGAMVAGIKHSVFMMIVGILVFLIAG